MLAESNSPVHSGRFHTDIHLPATAKLELIDFIAEELPIWRDHPDRPSKTAETSLTEHLCDHLNGATYYSEEWSHVQFRTETGDETNAGRKIDLTVKPRAGALILEGRRHSQFDSLFPIECKRLPTPKEKDRDEREYVITEPGTTGGVQRFKFGHHGASHSFAAMIAFVQERTLPHWAEQVNQWILSLAQRPNSVWKSSDELQCLRNDSLAKLSILRSVHQRIDALGECELRHLWIEMN